MTTILIDGVTLPLPDASSETSWEADQVALEQALASTANSAFADITTVTADLASVEASLATVNADQTTVNADAATVAAFSEGTWHTLTLAPGFTGTVEWRQDSNGKVWYRGSASRSTGISAVTVATAIPISPPNDGIHTVASFIPGVFTVPPNVKNVMLSFSSNGGRTITTNSNGGSGLGVIYFDQVSYDTMAY